MINKISTVNHESKLETSISYVLISGVVLSLILEITGVVLLYASGSSLNISQDAGMFIQGRDFFSFIVQHLETRPDGGWAIFFMTAGIIVLILTPFIRLIASVVYFLIERNFKFTLITLFVLIAVTLSLTLH